LTILRARRAASISRAAAFVVICGGLAACTTTNTEPTLSLAATPESSAAAGLANAGASEQDSPQVAAPTVPDPNAGYHEIGLASWYGAGFHGRQTANGESFAADAISAAHPSLPLPSYARVTNVENNHSIIVRVNDRGPFSDRRLIDVSARTADLLEFRRAGLAEVRVEYLQPAPLDGGDEAFLLASFRGPGEGSASTPGVLVASLSPRVPQVRPAAPVLSLSPVHSAPAKAAGSTPFDPYQALSPDRAPLAASPAPRAKPLPAPSVASRPEPLPAVGHVDVVASLDAASSPASRVDAAFDTISSLND
jgi:rare lipoprotein A